MSEVYYFGCWNRAGHYLFTPAGDTISGHHSAERYRIPSDNVLDGGAVFLPYPEKRGEGALTYLPANDLTVLAWWGNPWDTRGGVSNAVLVRGQHDIDATWAAFEKSFATLAPKLTRPVHRPMGGRANG